MQKCLLFIIMQIGNYVLLLSRTASNCARKLVNSGGGGESDNQTEGTKNKSPKDVKPKIREHWDTPKPESKFCRKRKETDEIQSKILNMIDEDKADEIDLAFAALTKRCLGVQAKSM